MNVKQNSPVGQITHPSQPTPHNDYVFCSSRGSSRNLSNKPISIYDYLLDNIGHNYFPHTPHHLAFNIRRGSNMNQIVGDIINEHLHRGSPSNSHAYIIGGYVDITYRDIDKSYRLYDSLLDVVQIVRYEEVIFRDTVEEAFKKAIYRYANAAQRLKQEGIRPCFATVPPSSLAKWNDYRWFRGDTAFLNHDSQYEDMQRGLIAACVKINGFICKLNALNGMYPPYLAGTVVRTQAADGKEPKFLYHKLFDGVHASDDLIKVWAAKTQKAINQNRLEPLENMRPFKYHSAEYLADVLEGVTL